MDRFDEMVNFIEHDSAQHVFIEPDVRVSRLKERLFDVMDTYKPATVVKAGLGNGTILYDLVAAYDSYYVVVEPSMKLITEFRTAHTGDPVLDKIKFINGVFHAFPVDYYKANLLICVDYLDFIQSAQAIDEFRRALEFESMFFLGMVVLDSNDIDGVYDDFMREVFPLHNDYYLENDLKTFMELNDFKFIKGSLDSYDRDLAGLVKFLGGHYNRNEEELMKAIPDGDNSFVNNYAFNNNIIREPYFMGLFMRKKLENKPL